MVETLEGTGYLFDGDRLVAPVRYRLRYATDPDGRGPATEGELMLRSVRIRGVDGGGYTLQAEAGFSLPVEVTGHPSGAWLPFRRPVRDGTTTPTMG